MLLIEVAGRRARCRAAACGLVALLAAPGCGGGIGGHRGAPTVTGTGVRLLPLPTDVVVACHHMQARVRWVVLCPSRLPRAISDRIAGSPPMPLVVQTNAEPDALDFSYNSPAGGDVPLRLNGPAIFLHFVLG